MLNYRNLNTAQAIVGSPPFHPSFAGKLIATDNSRKWTHWNVVANGASRIYANINTSELTLILAGGNLGLATGFGNFYSLDPDKFTDDDYGRVVPYYTTYFLIDPEKAPMLGLKGGRIMLAYIMAYIRGVGNVTLTPLVNSLLNSWPIATSRPLTQVYFDRELGGGQAQGNRIALKISSSPLTGQTDNSFLLTRLNAFIKDAKLAIRGAAQ